MARVFSHRDFLIGVVDLITPLTHSQVFLPRDSVAPAVLFEAPING